MKGFTLIELLVVVLIVGILAAVAVPQYQTAVDKAKYSKIIPMTRALKDATEVYYMANGTYSFQIGDIDISGPAGCRFPAGDNIVLCEDSWYDILNNAQNVMGFVGARYQTTTEQNAYRIWLDHNNNGKPAGQRECVAYDGTERAHRLCKAMGGVRVSEWSKDYILP
ncbi:type IV pilin protein [Candidatus Avelusimicrobium fimicolum]|uniref:type IV pilin protein n=1 Tax=Candidatus Avelusimicrobium fimicolum TaxID=3416216 RepID=UPI003D0BD0E3